MAKDGLNWGAILTGAALVTGIVAAVAFLPEIGAAIAGGGIAQTIATYVAEAATWAVGNKALAIGGAAVVGAATGALAGKLTSGGEGRSV